MNKNEYIWCKVTPKIIKKQQKKKDSSMKNITHDQLFLNAIEALTNSLLSTCYALIPIFMMMNLAVQYFKGLTQENLSIDYSPVLRGVVILIILFSYEELMEVVSSSIGSFSTLIDRPENVMDELKKLAETKPKAEKETDFLDAMGSMISQVSIDFSITGMLFSSIKEGLLLITRYLIDLIRQVLLGFLYVVGPISLMLSTIPGFSGLAMKWFQSYLSVQFWSVTLAILDALANVIAKSYELAPAALTSDVALIAVNIVIVIMYFMVPYLTSFMMGQAASGQFLSKVVGMAASGAKMAGSMASGGVGTIGSFAAKGATGAMSTASSAINTASSIGNSSPSGHNLPKIHAPVYTPRN